MSVDLSKLSAAPWETDHMDEASTSVIWATNRNGACMLAQVREEGISPARRRANAEFIALARNAFAAWMENPYWAVFEKDGKWICDPRAEIFFVKDDPLSAILAAQTWMKEQEERKDV